MLTRSWDCETEWITDLVKCPRLVCVSNAISPSEWGLFKWDHPEARDRVAFWLENDLSTGANIAFDCAVVMRQWPELTPLVFDAYESDRVIDTIPVQKLIDIAHGELHRAPKPYKGSNYSLQAMAFRHLDRVLDKTIRENYGQLRDVPIDQWNEAERQYPVDDAVSNLEVHEIQQLGWPELLADQFRQSRHAFWLYLVGAWGIRTDPVRVHRFHEMLLDEQADHIRTLQAEGLIRQKKEKGELKWVRDTKAAQARMAAVRPDCKLTDPSDRYPQGQVCLDYEQCKDSGDDILLAYGEYSSVKKQLSSDIPALLLGELHCRFDSLKETGRTGCSEPYNLQNPPRETGVRECFVPRPGTVFVDADYDGLESRAGAQACLELVGESTMADVLNAGEDLHLHMAAALLGIYYESAVARYKSHKKDKDDQEISDARQFAKIANFGLSGGMGAERFFEHAQKELKKVGAKELANRLIWEGADYDDRGNKRSRRCTAETCSAGGDQVCVTRIREVWRERWFEWPRYFSMNGERCRDDNGDPVSTTAEQLFSGRYRGRLGYTDLNNTYFQGLGADAAKAAGWRLTRACYDWTQGSVLYGSRIVNFVHDQFLVEAPISVAHECALEVGRIMVDEASPWFPDVPATVTPCLATCWSKDATAVYDRPIEDPNKRLIPWSPPDEERKAA